MVFEDDVGSPSTNPNDLTTLKIEDLDEGRGKSTNVTPGQNRAGAYNPVWKLQITDDRNAIKYEGNFVDRNVEKKPLVEGYKPLPAYEEVRRGAIE